MPFSAKDLEIMNARSSFERSLYDYPAIEGAKYLKSPDRFGGPSPVATKPPSPVTPIQTNAVDAAARLEQGFTGVRSLPTSARPITPPSAATSPLAEALASALKTPSLARIPIPNAIVSNAGRIAPIARGAYGALSTPAAGVGMLLYGPAKEIRDRFVEAEKNIGNFVAPGAGNAFKDALNLFDPIFGGQIPPWLNPLNYVPGKPQTKIEPGSKSFEVPIQTTSEGTFQVSYQLSTTVRNSTTGQISNPPPSTGTITLIGKPLTLVYTSEPTQKRLSIKYIDLRVGSGNYGKTITSDLISSVVGDDIQVTSLSGNISGLGAEPQYPISPSQAPTGPAAYSPDFVPVGAIKPFAPTVSPAPSSLPDPTKQPEKYPTIPSQPGAPTPAPNRPKEEKKVPAPFIPPLPFIPLLPAKAPSPANQSGWKSLTDPTQSPVPNPGTGMSGAKPPTVPPVASPPRCRDKCSQNIQDKVDGIGEQLKKGVPFANAAGQIIDLDLLNTINTKLGDQVPGGLSGFLGKFREAFDKLSEWLHLDRLLNLLTFLTTLQNAYFLCDSLKIVTLQMIGNGLNVIGIHDKDGNALNINKLLDDEIESVLKKLLGAETLDGMKKEWKALNRIYQAGANIINAVQNMVFSVIGALEVIGSWNAQIGNALKKYGVIGGNAFAWLNTTPNFHNKFFTTINNVLNIVNNIDFVSQTILSGRQAVDQMTQQSEELNKGLAEVVGTKPPEHKPTADAEAAAKSHSSSPAPSAGDIQSI